MIPSGYKTSKVYSVKPTSGDGDLTFTRSNDTATRVGPDGLIEKVRTNLILQSEAFNVTWVPVRSSVTANTTTAPDGTSTADTLFDNTDANLHYVSQSFTAITGPATISVYAKANQLSQIQIVAQGGTAAMGRGFDLSTGTTFAESVGGVTSNDLGQSITAVGDGWYRCTMSWTSTGQTSFWILTSKTNASTYVGTGTDGVFIWGAQLETGDIATDYIATTSAAVSVGPVANVPRLDYLNSSCGKLILEPQRTNLVTNSENLSGAGWSAQGSTITSNATTSPDGYSNADAIVETATTDEHNRIYVASLTAVSHTASVFLKKFNQTWCAVYLFNGTVGIRHWINLDTLTAGTSANIGAGITAPLTLTNYGNGWVRASMTWTADAASWSFYIACARSNGGATTYAGDGTSGLYAWGAQVEAGYPTSYIPTLGAAVTRGADDCRKGGISSILPTQTGTLYVEFDWQKTPADVQVLSIHNNSTGLAWINKSTTTSVQGTYFASGYIGTLSGAVSASAGIVKVAYAWTNGRQALYINGVQAGTDTAAITDSNDFNIFEFNGFWGIQKNGTSIASALVFPTALSNSDLAALTA